MAVQQNRLSAAEMFQLMTLVQQEFASKQLSDPAFAAYAAEKLGFTIAESSIKTAREAFKIPSTKETLLALEPVRLIDRITRLEAHVAALEKKLAPLLVEGEI